MDCKRCPPGEAREKCANPRHHCETCAGIGVIPQTEPDSYQVCPDCQPNDIRSERI